MLETISLSDTGSVSFGPFRLVPKERRLERDGCPVKIGARALEILLVLADRAGEVVSRNDLQGRVWPGMSVDDSILRVHMAALRKVLGDGEAGARYLANVSGRGYALLVDIRPAPSDDRKLPEIRARNVETEGKHANPTNLLLPATPLIGREGELATLAGMIGKHRLVTLTGVGGIGKTRLALELGRQVLLGFPGGVWLIDFAPLGSAQFLAGAVAAVLGVTIEDPRIAIPALASTLSKQPTLLIFDNCEHLVGECGTLIDALLAAAPPLNVLATSREKLRLPAETVLAVNPLLLPPEGATQIAGFGAVDLFLARARQAEYEFGLTAANAASVADICRRLEGIPLALEMAAGRLRMFGVEGLRDKLAEPLRLLKFPEGRTDARHLTLRDMVEWSFKLLDETEAAVFRRLGSFSGSFSLDAVVAIAGAGLADDWEAMDALGRLIEKSLVMIELGDPPRYRLLETLRHFVIEKLAESDEAEASAEHHAQFYTALLEESFTQWETMREPDWKARYLPETDNIRAAMEWALANPARGELAIQMAGPASLLLRYSHFYEARRYNDLAEALIDPDSPPGTTARLLSQTASLVKQTDVHRALDLNTRAAALYRQIGDDARADPLRSNGNILDMLGRYAEAKQSLLEAREVFANSGRQKNLCRVNVNLGALAVKTGDLSDAEEWFGQALAIAKAINEPSFEAAVGCAVAELEFQLGNTDRAIKLGLESLSGLRRANWLPFISSGLANLASYLLAQRRVAEARTFAAENFELTRVLGGLHLFVCLWSWAWIGALENRFAEAALILGFVEAGYIRSGLAIKCTEQFVREQIRGLLDPALPEAEIQARLAEGGAWTEQEAASFVGSRLIGSQPHAVSIRTP